MGKIILSPEVLWFAEQMELKLRANKHKSGWSKDHPIDLFIRMQEEAAELAEAINEGNGVVSEAADVANFAMMIADICR